MVYEFSSPYLLIGKHLLNNLRMLKGSLFTAVAINSSISMT